MTLFLGFAAVNTGNNLLYLMVSAFLGFMAVSGLLGHKNLDKLEVRIVPEQELYAGLQGGLHVQVANRRRRLPAFLLRVSLGGQDILLPALSPGGKRDGRISVMLPHRGYHELPVVEISSSFPVNFFVRSKGLKFTQQLLVFPRPLRTGTELAGESGRNPEESDLPLPGQDGELRSIDTYQTGDPLKSIHWKLSARHQDLKTKRHNRSGAPAVLLELDSFPGTLEERISRCVYRINDFHRRKIAVGLRLPHKTYPPSVGPKQKYRLLKELALYGQA